MLVIDESVLFRGVAGCFDGDIGHYDSEEVLRLVIFFNYFVFLNNQISTSTENSNGYAYIC